MLSTLSNEACALADNEQTETFSGSDTTKERRQAQEGSQQSDPEDLGVRTLANGHTGGKSCCAGSQHQERQPARFISVSTFKVRIHGIVVQLYICSSRFRIELDRDLEDKGSRCARPISRTLQSHYRALPVRFGSCARDPALGVRQPYFFVGSDDVRNGQ